MRVRLANLLRLLARTLDPAGDTRSVEHHYHAHFGDDVKTEVEQRVRDAFKDAPRISHIGRPH